MRFKHTALTLTTLLGLSLPLVGCTSNDAPIAGRAERYEYPWLIVGSESLRVDTMISDARRSRDQFGLLHVTVPVRNTTDQQLYIDCRFTFMDVNGQETSSLRKTVTIPSRGAQNVEAVSTSNKAESFQVELQYPRVN